VRTLAPIVIVAAVAVGSCGPQGARSGVGRVASKARDIALAAESRIVSARVVAGATLASVLRSCHVADRDVVDAVEQARMLFDPRKLRSDQPYRVETRSDGTLRRFEYEIDGDRVLKVQREDAALVASVVPIAKTRHEDVVHGRIDRDSPSLFAAMDESGESIDLSLALAGIFSGEIDFNSDLQPGDQFALLVEKQYRADDAAAFAGYGPILAAEFDNDGRRVRAVRFTPPGGTPGYYDERGVSMRRFFLRSPLKFEPVVTSPFSRSRLHPILREYRPHLGVDYRAPAGAPVVAVADGVVLQAGMSGGAGRLVHLRHANHLESEYMHLSAIAVHAGQHVRQGDLIGRVGSSGLATGPHLDYRVKRDGAFVNPLSAQRDMPPADPIAPAQMPQFIAVRDRMLARLAAAPVQQSAAARADSPSPNRP
jgi:murein DD-endopeptidase MepM/ murein hydrolase activator NlpD